ncbi:MAG: hypothetical protein MUF54_20415, partial [Polyangiaceae bacterium]|nr:hypothetical protein [Polyangiaceae bacterium]
SGHGARTTGDPEIQPDAPSTQAVCMEAPWTRAPQRASGHEPRVRDPVSFEIGTAPAALEVLRSAT